MQFYPACYYTNVGTWFKPYVNCEGTCGKNRPKSFKEIAKKMWSPKVTSCKSDNLKYIACYIKRHQQQVNQRKVNDTITCHKSGTLTGRLPLAGGTPAGKHWDQKLAKFLTNFFNFQSYWLLFWSWLVLRRWLVLRMSLPLASLATGFR